jgi:PAS domain S-box-containing protein
VQTEQIKVLLVDDDQGDYEMIRVMLSQAEHGNYKLDWVGSFEEALDAFRGNEHDVYLLDYFLEDRTGLDLLREAERLGISAPIIMLTGRGSRKVDLEAMEAGAAEYLVKGTFDPDTLERSIRYSLERTGVERALVDTAGDREVEEDLSREELVGAEGRFRAVFHATGSGIALVDLDGLLLEVNPAFFDLFFSTAEDVEGASYIELLERSDQAPALKELGALSRGERSHLEAERTFLERGGTLVRARTSITLIRNDAGDPSHLVVLLEGLVRAG